METILESKMKALARERDTVLQKAKNVLEEELRESGCMNLTEKNWRQKGVVKVRQYDFGHEHSQDMRVALMEWDERKKNVTVYIQNPCMTRPMTRTEIKNSTDGISLDDDRVDERELMESIMNLFQRQ